MIKLTFTTDDYLDKEDLIKAMHASEAYSCIHDMEQVLRTAVKRGFLNNEELTPEQYAVAEKIQDIFFDIIRELPGRYT